MFDQRQGIILQHQKCKKGKVGDEPANNVLGCVRIVWQHNCLLDPLPVLPVGEASCSQLRSPLRSLGTFESLKATDTGGRMEDKLPGAGALSPNSRLATSPPTAESSLSSTFGLHLPSINSLPSSSSRLEGTLSSELFLSERTAREGQNPFSSKRICGISRTWPPRLGLRSRCSSE